jgi:membrane-associated HD superfamily phosphohydrolase
MIAGDLAQSHRAKLSPWELARALLVGGLFAVTFAILFSFQTVPETPPTLLTGQVSPKTILAPVRITYASQIETSDARTKAEASIADVYKPPNSDLAREQVRIATRVFDNIDSLRHDPFTTPEQKVDWVRNIPTVTLPAIIISRTVMLDENA